MTASDAVLDTQAWWEIFEDTEIGRRLSKKYLDSQVTVHTSAIAIAEIVAKLEVIDPKSAALAAATINARSEVHPVTAEIAEEAGKLRGPLRRASRHASLADAIMLATARSLGVKLVSNDAGFKGQPDVTGF